MDTQLKKGILDACVLAALKTEESYGYKIINDLSEIINVSESTLYPILRRLEQSGCLEIHSKTIGGRVRKYYSITEKGIIKLYEFRDDMEWVGKAYMYVDNQIRSKGR